MVCKLFKITQWNKLILVSFKPKATTSKPKSAQKPAQKLPQQPKEVQKKATFSIGGNNDPKSPKHVKKPEITAIEQLKVSEIKPSRASSKSPSRMTQNASFHQLSAIEVAMNSSPTHK